MDTVEALIEEASFCTLSDPGRAREYLNRALVEQPWNARAHSLLGITESDVNNLADAAYHLEIATDLQPFNGRYWYDLGVVEMRRKNIALARDHFEVALTQRTDYVDALLNLGTCYAETGEEIAAVAALAEVITLDPTGKRRMVATAVNKDLAMRTVRPRPRPRSGFPWLAKRRRQVDSSQGELSPAQRLFACRDTRDRSLEEGVEAFRELLASLEENSRGYCIAAQHLANIYFWLHQYDKSFRLSSSAVASLSCVLSLVVERSPYRLLVSGTDQDAKRIYAKLLSDLGVDVDLVALEFKTSEGPKPDFREATVMGPDGPYEILRGGNIFVITAPDGKKVEHQMYDRSDRVLGVW
jgi:hypothetical protein